MKQIFLILTLAVVLLSCRIASAARQKKAKNHGEKRVPRDAKEEEQNILVNLYNVTNGPQWIRQWGWHNSSIPYCDWEGVGCNNSGVTSLELAANSLQGNVSDLSGLQYLSLLDLSKNKLEGSIGHVGLEQMNVLHNVSLAYNGFVGTLPKTLSQSILHFDVSNNHLEGTVGTAISNLTLLQHLGLNGNILKGELPYIGNLTSLNFLDVSKNEGLSGTFRESGISNLTTTLQTLHLANNNFTGSLDSLVNFTLLKSLDLSGNEFEGGVDGIANLTMATNLNLARNRLNGTLPDMSLLTSLEELDVSDNDLTGSIEGLATLVTLQTINLANNKLNGTLDSLAALTSLQVLDAHHNNFTRGLEIISSFTKLEALNVAENSLNGTLPQLNALSSLRYLNVSSNFFTGTIPNLAGNPLLRLIDLSHQFVSEVTTNGTRITQGLTGTIPEAIGELIFLQEIWFNENLLSGTIPQDISQLGFLSILSLQNNRLTGTIPASLDLLGQLEVVSLARNQLYGPIPELGGSEEVIRSVALKDNSELGAPAPFRLCDLDDLDIREDDSYCPMDRQALVAFHSSTKGADWNDDTNWLDPDRHHCTWFGVTCDETNTAVLHLSLPRNGLAGRIPSDLFNLTSIQSIDLNDNELYGSIPSEIGWLTDLKKLRLSYNQLTAIPPTFAALTGLSFLHLHGNRISGNDTFITVTGDASSDEVEHAFISDCGDPVDSSEPFECDGCDMCCNSLEECQVPVDPSFGGYNGWVIALIITAIVLAALLVAGTLIYALVQQNKLAPSKTNARGACGDESVYSFVITNSYAAWILVIITIFIQIAIFALFLNASNFDSEISDFIYTWRCPRNSESCDDDSNVSIYGWIVWALLVFTSILEDVANGIKLIFLAASRTDIHSFCGSAIILSMSALAAWTSLVYNRAIATSSTELIVNAVILLFINDIDDQIYNAVRVIRPKWLEMIGNQAGALSAKIVEKDVDDTPGEVEKPTKVDETTFYPAETWESTRELRGR